MSLRKRLDEELARLVIGEDAVMERSGRRMMVVSAEFVTTIFGAGEKVMGPAIGGIHYLAGERSGRKLGELARAKGPDADGADLVSEVMASLEVRALGQLGTDDLDVAAGTGVLRLHRSPYAEAFSRREHPVCHALTGLWAGLLSALSGREVLGEEVRCRAKGDPICEIVASPGPNRSGER
jgi:predicted hydrocarbon binding protein